MAMSRRVDYRLDCLRGNSKKSIYLKKQHWAAVRIDRAVGKADLHSASRATLKTNQHRNATSHRQKFLQQHPKKLNYKKI